MAHDKRSNEDEYNQNRKRHKRQKLSEEEEDFMFFESLLAHVWKIPNERILSFRCKIQEIVEHFAYGNERSNAVGSKHPWQ